MPVQILCGDILALHSLASSPGATGGSPFSPDSISLRRGGTVERIGIVAPGARGRHIFDFGFLALNWLPRRFQRRSYPFVPKGRPYPTEMRSPVSLLRLRGQLRPDRDWQRSLAARLNRCWLDLALHGIEPFKNRVLEGAFPFSREGPLPPGGCNPCLDDAASLGAALRRSPGYQTAEFVCGVYRKEAIDLCPAAGHWASPEDLTASESLDVVALCLFEEDPNEAAAPEEGADMAQEAEAAAKS